MGRRATIPSQPLHTYGTDRLDELALANVARHHPDAVLGATGHEHVHGVSGLAAQAAPQVQAAHGFRRRQA